MDIHAFWFTNRSNKIGYESQDQRSSFATVYPRVVKGHPQITDCGLQHHYIYINIHVYLQLLHSYFPRCGAQCFCWSLKRSCLTGRLCLVLYLTHSNCFHCLQVGAGEVTRLNQLCLRQPKVTVVFCEINGCSCPTWNRETKPENHPVKKWLTKTEKKIVCNYSYLFS